MIFCTIAPARSCFSTSHPPSVAATCIAAFDVLENEPERIESLWENTRFWKKELGLLGFNIGGKTTPASETPITPIIIGDGKLTMDFSRELFKEGVMGTGIAFPTVPEGKARIRTIMTATHTKDELQQALEVLKGVGKKMGIVGHWVKVCLFVFDLCAAPLGFRPGVPFRLCGLEDLARA